jgi:selenocysteine lyase/cysteine desulfurase
MAVKTMTETTQHHGFSIDTGVYLMAHSIGRPPLIARQALLDFADSWEFSSDNWPQWLQAIHEFNQSLSDLLNTSVANICPQVNLSSALSKIVSALPDAGSKNTLLLSEYDFPSMGFVLDKAQRRGYKLRFIPAQLDHTDLNTWSDHLSADVAACLITHVHSNTGCRVPQAEISRLCQQRGIVSIVDICQSVGVIPIDLSECAADFVLGSCVKWLCGGPGAGFLWANPATVTKFEPLDVGWFSHQNPMEFDIHHFEYQSAALRFWGGTPSVLPYMVAKNSIEHINALGVKNIHDHNIKLRQILCRHLSPQNIVSSTDTEKTGGTLVLNFIAEQSNVQQRLEQAGAKFDQRSAGFRISPHIYNSEHEIEILTEALRAKC